MSAWQSHLVAGWVGLILVVAGSPTCLAEQTQFPLRAKRILFLGDSITHAGGYIAWIETQLRLQKIQPLPEIINLGLSSETCSGLSEADHPFPRPDLHERLGRALAKVKPDVVVACYGMNDGIYHPFDEGRFRAYQQGVRRLVDKVHAAGAKLVLMTPPPFDPVPLKGRGKLKPAGQKRYAYFAMYENYDDVLRRYSAWLTKQDNKADLVVDIHTPVLEYLTEKRKANPKFTLSPDGIHPNAEGHQFLGETILQAWGLRETLQPNKELLTLVQKRTTILHDAWLSQVGHQRPGIKPGLSLENAYAEVQKLDAKINSLLAQAPQSPQ